MGVKPSQHQKKVKTKKIVRKKKVLKVRRVQRLSHKHSPHGRRINSRDTCSCVRSAFYSILISSFLFCAGFDIAHLQDSEKQSAAGTRFVTVPQGTVSRWCHLPASARNRDIFYSTNIELWTLCSNYIDLRGLAICL